MRQQFRSLFPLRLWSSLKQRSRKRIPQRPRRVRLGLEQLEDRITPTGPTLTDLAGFNLLANGLGPPSGLIMDGSGNLYGTMNGGITDYGTIFELAKSNTTITTLASFDGTNGANPYGTLLIDSSGNLYGTTAGGTNSAGTVFELAKVSSTINVLASFNDTTNGAHPVAGLIMDSSGNLYGTTEYGGLGPGFGDGTIFEWVKASGTITTLAEFDGTDGANPVTPLIMDSSGNLYGTTPGTVFELAKNSHTITTLASLGGTNGSNPSGPLLMDSSGNLYGTATSGGNGTGLDTDGTVFEWVKASGTITAVLFDGTNGQDPSGGLIMDSSGNLYGITGAGGLYGYNPGYGYGTVFELAKGSNTITSLVSFDGTDGAGPIGPLVADSSGNLYGTTDGGGPATNDEGVVFELSGAGFVTQTDQWTGASGTDTNWSDGANWSTGAPPTTSQTAVFTDNSSVKNFTATVDSGFTNSIAGLDIDSSWGGTITVNSPLTVTGNFTMASGTFGGSGAVTITGAKSSWTGGTIDVGSGGFTNSGTLTYSGGNNIDLSGSGSFLNKKSFVQTSTGTLSLDNGATLDNAKGATYNIESNGGISQSGGGTFLNAGTLEKTKGTGTSTLAATTLNNTGTVKESSGTLDIAATVTQVSGSTLTAGTWDVTGTPSVSATLDITSVGSLTTLGSSAKVTLSGPNATFSNLSGLSVIDKSASLTLAGGGSFATTGALTNNGSLTIGPASVLTVGGSFTQSSTATLAIQLGGTDSAPTFGQLLSTTGTVTLAGKLSVTSTVVPAVGSSFNILDNEGNSTISGTFAQGASLTVKKGGTTMTFGINYAGSDDDGSNNVVIKRTA